MERFIDYAIVQNQTIKHQFKIQYGEIYSLALVKHVAPPLNLKSSMERFIVL